MIRSMATDEPISRLDIIIAIAFSVLAVVLMVVNLGEEDVDANVLAVPAFVAVTVPLAWRRRAPVAALAATLAAVLAHVALFGDMIRCGVAFTTVLVLAFAAAALLELGPALLGLVVGWAIIVVVAATDVVIGIADAPQFAVLAAVIWGIGRVVRSRSTMAQALRAQTHELREARDERARLEIAGDRARLSAELDELLRRRLAELARLAASAPADSDPASARATLADIEREGRRTLQEMRALVGVLREDPADAPTAPQPTLTHMDALLLRAKGEAARLQVEGSPRVLPAGVELSAYRIVEHLLAALEEAAGVDVCVRFADDALELTVRGRPRRGAAAAIERARERARLHRGTLESTVRDGRAEAVALLPIASV